MESAAAGGSSSDRRSLNICRAGVSVRGDCEPSRSDASVSTEGGSMLATYFALRCLLPTQRQVQKRCPVAAAKRQVNDCEWRKQKNTILQSEIHHQKPGDTKNVSQHQVSHGKKGEEEENQEKALEGRGTDSALPGGVAEET